MAVSDVSICNLALARVGQSVIVNLNDTDRLARLCKLHYEAKRDALLRSYRWTFAMARASLPTNLPAPAFGYTNAYLIPTDCLRVVEIDDQDTELEWDPPRWEMEQGRILTDLAAPLKVRYIKRVDDPTAFDASFADALAAYLALYFAPSVKELDEGLTQALRQEFEFIVQQARRTNAIEGRPRRRVETRSRWVSGYRSPGRY